MLVVFGKRIIFQKDTVLTKLNNLTKTCLEKRQNQDFYFVCFDTIWDERSFLYKIKQNLKLGLQILCWLAPQPAGCGITKI